MRNLDNVVAIDKQDRGSPIPQRIEILEGCRDIASRHVGELLHNVFDNVDDTLFDLADKAESNTIQTTYFDAMREVRLKRQEMETRFKQEFIRYFDESAGLKPESRGQDGIGNLSVMDLQLVEHDALEEDLAITNLVSKTYYRFQPPLQLLTQRFAVLVNGRKIEEDNCPLNPRQICQAFREAAQVLEADIKIKLILFKLLDRHVMEHIGQLYDAVNEHLVKNGILPDFKPSVRRVRRSAGQGGMPDLDARLKEMRAALEGSGPDAGTGAMGGVGFVPVTDGTGGGGGEGGDLFQLMSQLVSLQRPGGAVPGMMPGMPGGQVGAPGGMTYVSQDVLDALTQLQQQGLASYAGGEMVSGEAIKSNVITQIQQVRGASAPGAINAGDDSTIDLVEMLFDFIFSDSHLPDRFKALIGQMQIPMLKVSILDKAFFSKKTHPARRLLDALSQAAIACGNADDEGAESLHRKMEAVVARIQKEFDTDIGLFATVLEDFEGFLADEKQRHAAAEQERIRTAEETEEMGRIRSVIVREIAQRLHQQKVPGIVHSVLGDLWTDVMLGLYRGHGSESAQWQQAMQFVDDLIWSVHPKTRTEDRRHMTGLIPRLIGALRSGAESIGWTAARLDPLLKELQECHIASLHGQLYETPEVDATISKGVDIDGEISEMEALATELPDLDGIDEEGNLVGQDDVFDRSEHATMEGEEIILSSEQPGEPEPDIEDEYTEMVRDMEVGDWVEFSNDDGKVRRLKLEWKGDVVGEYLFVNWRYQVEAERTLRGLAAELRSGRARLMEATPVFDKALNSVMDRLLKVVSKDQRDHAGA